jgi:chemotaxis signal transduction protein
VDTVLGFREITADEIAASFFDNKKSERRPVKGTTRDLVAIIDIDRLFGHTEISFGRGAKIPVVNERGLS